MKRGFKSKSEVLAKEVREKLGLKPWQRLTSKSLAEDLGFTIISPSQVPGMTEEMIHCLTVANSNEWSAVTLEDDFGFLMIENPAHSLKRRESTRMHELAHVLCKHEPTALSDISGLGFATRAYDKDQEDEADWLGRCLHLPKPVLGYCLNRGWTVSKISDEFVASESLVNYRLNKSGVLTVRRRMAVSKS